MDVLRFYRIETLLALVGYVGYAHFWLDARLSFNHVIAGSLPPFQCILSHAHHLYERTLILFAMCLGLNDGTSTVPLRQRLIDIVTCYGSFA